MVEGMKLSIVDGVGVPLGEIEILHVHVALDGEEISGSIFVDEGDLLVAVDDHEVRAGRVEGEVADGVACEGFDDTETVHVLIHAVEVPQSNMVVEPSARHSVAFGLDCDA